MGLDSGGKGRLRAEGVVRGGGGVVEKRADGGREHLVHFLSYIFLSVSSLPSLTLYSITCSISLFPRINDTEHKKQNEIPKSKESLKKGIGCKYISSPPISPPLPCHVIYTGSLFFSSPIIKLHVLSRKALSIAFTRLFAGFICIHTMPCRVLRFFLRTIESCDMSNLT